ncbi:Oidioi.mRNA.OKI2018_I69.chr1.g2497.t1.cds [Oikopleura dioica]|uniref:Oidioi.mRNA.OKI2018_I69.chr1.g2497.t1.cds n=1 Tax=Oikopleura dioica TaxID=34765 RepID=A0ABN7SY67_OIKDI|nr:Oidioi.mRNA.OKI2018_I69.chr1.g2497.t1.cds [Oikopleura dioica]
MTILWIKCRVFQHYQTKETTEKVFRFSWKYSPEQSLYDFAKLVKGQCSDEDCLGWKSINITWIDEEGDAITLQTAEQLSHLVSEFIILFRTLKIIF